MTNAIINYFNKRINHSIGKYFSVSGSPLSAKLRVYTNRLAFINSEIYWSPLSGEFSIDNFPEEKIATFCIGDDVAKAMNNLALATNPDTIREVTEFYYDLTTTVYTWSGRNGWKEDAEYLCDIDIWQINSLLRNYNLSSEEIAKRIISVICE